MSCVEEKHYRVINDLSTEGTIQFAGNSLLILKKNLIYRST